MSAAGERDRSAARAALWVVTGLALALLACAPQRDLIALRKSAPLCTDASGPGCMDAGCSTCVEAGIAQPTDAGPPPPSCGAADSCTTDPRCSDAAICQPVTPSGACRSRACSALGNRSELCSSSSSAVALGDACSAADDNPRFRYALCSVDSLQTQRPLTIRGDVAVDGDVSFEDAANIAGTLYYARALRESSAGLLKASSTQRASARCVPPPELALDIAALVKAHAVDNDNAAVGGSVERLRHFTGDLSLTLPCGRYYVTGLEGDGQVLIRAQGNVALFIDGNVQLEKRLRIETPDGARMTMVVNGAFNVAREGVTLGQSTDARHLLMVARQVHLESDGESAIGGALYAPASELLVTHKLSVAGALFIGSGRLFGDTDLAYAPAATFAADSCGL